MFYESWRRDERSGSSSVSPTYPQLLLGLLLLGNTVKAFHNVLLQFLFVRLDRTDDEDFSFLISCLVFDNYVGPGDSKR